MILTGKKWQCANKTPHYVVETIFDLQDITKAIKVADSKVNHINVHNPGGLKRSPDVIHNRIVAGKLADSAVFELLRRRIASSHLNSSIIEYDEIRNDGFVNVDPYDLLLQKQDGTIELIEVRSSYCYKLAPEQKIIDKLSIYGWYTSLNKPQEPIKDWYWQFVYYMHPRDISDDTLPSIPIFEEELSKGEIKGYIVGGASRKQLDQYGTVRLDQDGARYMSLSPICNGGQDYFNMVNSMFNINISSTNPN